MSTFIGRATLRPPSRITDVQRRFHASKRTAAGGVRVLPSLQGPREFMVESVETGGSAQTRMDALTKEARRFGAMYCSEDNTGFPSGYYELQGDPEYEKPPGGTGYRPWLLRLVAQDWPVIMRQAEDDLRSDAALVSATVSALSSSEGKHITIDPTSTPIVVLQPRTVSGAEKVNLPEGTYEGILRCKRLETSGAFRWRTTNAAGTELVAGSAVTPPSGTDWQDVSLGEIAVAAADAGANWYEVDLTTGTNNGWALDYFLIKRVA